MFNSISGQVQRHGKVLLKNSRSHFIQRAWSYDKQIAMRKVCSPRMLDRGGQTAFDCYHDFCQDVLGGFRCSLNLSCFMRWGPYYVVRLFVKDPSSYFNIQRIGITPVRHNTNLLHICFFKILFICYVSEYFACKLCLCTYMFWNLGGQRRASDAWNWVMDGCQLPCGC